MTIEFTNDRLLDTMNVWRITNAAGQTHIRVAIILVDETLSDHNKSVDRASRHRLQSALLIRAAPTCDIFIVNYGAEGEYAERDVFSGGYGPDLDTAIPGGTFVYKKGPYETDGFVNPRLKADVIAGNYTDVIIMGQSTNACCAATARGAAALGLRIHVCESLVRGGNAESASPHHFPGIGFAGWPDGTTVYTAL